MVEYQRNEQGSIVKSFFERTMRNLKLYEEFHRLGDERFNSEVTQLINSFLGLIVFVKEDGLETSKRLNDFIQKCPPTTWEYCKRNGQEEDHNFVSYLRHIRNAISHGRIEAVVDPNDPSPEGKKEIESLIFSDEDPRHENNHFKLALSIDEIKELVFEIAKTMSIEIDC